MLVDILTDRIILSIFEHQHFVPLYLILDEEHNKREHSPHAHKCIDKCRAYTDYR